MSALLVALPASAHVGAVLATAKFTSPAPPTVTAAGAMAVTLSPYTFPTADQTFPVSWTDGDNAPTGHFYFYYFDHDPTREIQIGDIQTAGTPAIELATGQQAAVWAGCMCPFPDMGSVTVICPDAACVAEVCGRSERSSSLPPR